MDSTNIVFLIFIVIGIIMALYGAFAMIQANNSKEWPDTQGKILRSELIESVDSRGNVTHYPEIEYVYKVKGEFHQSSRVQFGFKTAHSIQSTKAELQKYPKGKIVDVYYDPKKSSSAVLETGKTSLGLTLTILGASFIILSIVMWGVFQFL